MNPQLKHLQIDLERASKRVHALTAEVPEEQWDLRPGPDRWSVAECIEHLIITSTESLPPIRKALTGMEGQRSVTSRRYRRDFLGWLIWKSQAETTAMRSRTAAGFVPTGGVRRQEATKLWDGLQRELLELVGLADGLPLGSTKIPSAFNGRVKYNLFSALSILAVHQHRHLGQAERTAAEVIAGNS